jgi:hypothetical protein
LEQEVEDPRLLLRKLQKYKWKIEEAGQRKKLEANTKGAGKMEQWEKVANKGCGKSSFLRWIRRKRQIFTTAR